MTAGPVPLVAFVLTIAMSFLVGLALREYYIAQNHPDYFGSVRTYTFIGMLGFGLYELQSPGAYAAGLLGLSAFLTVYYWMKSEAGRPGMIGILTALLTYLIGPLALTTPAWFVILFVVTVLFALNAKERIRTLSERITQREVVTLATFLTLAGVVLPLLPRDVIAPFLPLTPYQIWLAVVVSAGISYASYLLQTYVFPSKGLLLTGFLGGLYSSTASTLVIARRTRDAPGTREIAAALIAATAMMYFRLIALTAIFDTAIALRLAPLFVVLGAAAAGAALGYARNSSTAAPDAAVSAALQRNPLELNSAGLFALMLVIMSVATHFAMTIGPATGLNSIAFLSGIYDVDPFVVALLQTHAAIESQRVAEAIVVAAAANNVLKAAYAAIFAQRGAALRAGFVLLVLAGLSVAYLALAR